MRQLSIFDKVLTQVNDALTTVFTVSSDARKSPAEKIDDVVLTEKEKKNSMGYMRVNHTGEVCAQALYRGQSIGCRSEKTRRMLEQSCIEETDHLAWTKQRLSELNGKTSYLNIFFYGNAFFIGAVASLVGDRWSLGFVSETEIQVAAHLEKHLEKLSMADLKSRAIVSQMQIEEMEHDKKAVAAGAVELPLPIKQLMQLHAKVMTTLAYWI